MPAQVQLCQDVASQIRKRAVDLRASQVYPQDDKTAGIVFDQGPAAPSAPFRITMRTHETFFDQLIDDAHDSGQADIQPLGDGGTRDRACAADDFQDRRPVDVAHGCSRDRERVG